MCADPLARSRALRDELIANMRPRFRAPYRRPESDRTTPSNDVVTLRELGECVGDDAIAIRCGVLIDHCRGRRRVAQPGLQLGKRRAGGRSKGCARVPQVVDAQVWSSCRRRRVGEGSPNCGRRKVWCALPGEQQALGP